MKEETRNKELIINIYVRMLQTSEFNVKLSPKHDGAHGLRINVLTISQLLSDVTFGIRSD